MTKPATGAVVTTKNGRLQGVVTLPGGKRKRLPAFPMGTTESEARESVAAQSSRLRLATPVTEPELDAAPQEDTDSSVWERMSIQPGAKFGRWTVLMLSPGDKKKTRGARCVCECGHKTWMELSDIRRGRSLQCVDCRHAMLRACGENFKRDCERRALAAVCVRKSGSIYVAKSGFRARVAIGGRQVSYNLHTHDRELAKSRLLEIVSGDTERLCRGEGHFQRIGAHYFARSDRGTSSAAPRERIRMCGDTCDCDSLDPWDADKRAWNVLYGKTSASGAAPCALPPSAADAHVGTIHIGGVTLTEAEFAELLKMSVSRLRRLARAIVASPPQTLTSGKP